MNCVFSCNRKTGGRNVKISKNYLLLIPLFVLAIASITLWGYQWIDLTSSDNVDIIQLDPLGETNVEIFYTSTTTTTGQNTGNTGDTSSELEDEAETSGQESGATTVATYTTDNGEFTVRSDDTLWEQYTSVNIFNGLEIVAPGDHGEFYFTLSNGKDSEIEYTMSIEKFEHETLLIPLTFRLKTAEGNYIGSDEWISGDELEYVASTLSSNNNFSYILEWKWDPYVDDEYDTLLGTSEKLEYTMTITITATGESQSMNLPQTGDSNNMTMLIIIVVASALMIMVLIFVKRKNEKDNDKNQ